MAIQNSEFDPNHYVSTMEFEYAGMINALNYIHREAEEARLSLVSLHLKIAIAELKEFSANEKPDRISAAAK